MNQPSDLHTRIKQHFIDSIAAKQKAQEHMLPFVEAAAHKLFRCLMSGGKILLCGNGGSAADAQHFAAELVGRFEKERRELAAMSLATDTSILTAVANDYSYDEVFAKQVRGLGKAGDVLIAISTSGNSPSILNAATAAQDLGLGVIGLTGKQGGKLAQLLSGDDVLLCVPQDRTARIQEVHLLVVHCLCDAIDAMLETSQEKS
jgi:D-sedoheptulose 7-phosphate isomerase